MNEMLLTQAFYHLGPSRSTAPKASRRSDNIMSAALSRYSISNQVFYERKDMALFPDYQT